MWLGGVVLWYRFAETRPRLPVPEQGRTYALNTHGDFAYLTRGEFIGLNGLMVLGFVLVLIAVAVHRRTRSGSMKSSQ